MRTPEPPTIEALDDDVRALLRSAASIPRAPTESKMRVQVALASAVAMPSPSAPGPGEGMAHAITRIAWLRRALPLLGTFALGTSAGVFVAHRAGPRPPVTMTRAATATVRTPSLTPIPRPPPAPPSSASPERDRHPPAAPALEAAASTASNQLVAESMLLDRARTAIDNAQPAEALALTRKHARVFARGKLSQERDAMTIRALIDLGRETEARSTAARFHARYPGSVLWPRIESLIDGPGSNP